MLHLTTITVLVLVAAAAGAGYHKDCPLSKSKPHATLPLGVVPVYRSAGGRVDLYINDIDADQNVRKVELPSPDQAITHYAYKIVRDEEGKEVQLPLYVKAHITPKTILEKGVRNDVKQEATNNCELMGMIKGEPLNNDERGHLISSKNGGPGKIFNVAPQLRSTNAGMNPNAEEKFLKLVEKIVKKKSGFKWTKSDDKKIEDFLAKNQFPSAWYYNEMFITKFLEDIPIPSDDNSEPLRYVDQSVAVYYQEGCLRPVAFGTYEKYVDSRYEYLGEDSYVLGMSKFSNMPDTAGEMRTRGFSATSRNRDVLRIWETEDPQYRRQN